MGASHPASCTLCEQPIALGARASEAVCEQCGRAHRVVRDGDVVKVISLAGGGHTERRVPAMALGFVGLFLAVVFLLTARWAVDNALTPDCRAACSAAGLEFKNITNTEAAAPRVYWKSPNRCHCQREKDTSPPPNCRAESSRFTVACDAGYWLAGGRHWISLAVNLGFAVTLILPFLLWLLWLLFLRQRQPTPTA